MYGDECLSLPPVPDRETGEPRPTRPRNSVTGKLQPDAPTPPGPVPARIPPGPVHLGPLLEWRRPSPRQRWLAPVGVVGVVIVSLSGRNRGFDWTTVWQIWCGLAAYGVYVYVTLNREWFAAGAVWAQSGTSWVNTYELVEIRITGSGAYSMLTLTDASGRVLAGPLRELEANWRLWDLIYNGILHSAASGNCTITRRAQKHLRLPIVAPDPAVDDPGPRHRSD